MRNSPWLQQRRSESAPPAQRPKDPPPITAKEQEEIVDRLSRPTESAMYRQSLYWKLDSFMDRGFHSWSKMDLFSDCKRCMWTPDGTIKGSCKIRPLKVEKLSLPPLERTSVSRGSLVLASRGSRRSEDGRSSAASERAGSLTVRASLATPATGRTGSRRQEFRSRGSVTWRQPGGGSGGITSRPSYGSLRFGDATGHIGQQYPLCAN